jgi:muramoyltetrapeptide carboxypeptidase
MSLPLPRPVRPGSRLALVAPAGPFDEEAFCAGLGWLAERYEPVHRPDIFAKTGYLAGDDSRRLAELREAIADPSVDAIVCARGGFGTTRILPGIDPEDVRRANKLVVGFSDITALHAVWGAAGVRSIHAPMVAALGSASPDLRARWIDTIENPGAERSWELCPLRESSHPVSGLLTGGNLAVLAALLGTPRAPRPAGRILFIEDVGERPYRIDRVLTTMKQAGFFEDLAGLVVGAFTEGDPGADGVTLDDVISGHFADAPFPVLVGVPAGHIAENEPLPFGATARIEGGVLTVNPSLLLEPDPT